MFICHRLQHQCCPGKKDPRVERCVCFYFSSGSRTEPRSGLPIFIALQRRHRDLEKQSRDSFELGRTHFFSLSEEERALCRGQSLSHERKRGIMPDGSLLFPEGGGELPPYANARNWPRPTPISRHGASQLSFAARETDVEPCITSGKLKLPHHQRRYLFYSPLCVVACKGLENRYLCKKSSAVITDAATVQSTANANVPPLARRRPTEHALSVVTTIFMAFGT